MKVTEMSMFRTLQSNLAKSSSNLNDLYLQASTGSKLIDASDDPSAIGSVFSSRTSIATSDRYLETISETQDGIDILDGYLDTAEEIMVRAKEIAVAAQNGSYSDSDLETYADEVVELQQELLDIANTRVDGKYIFAGYAEDTEPFSGDPVVYNGTSDHKMVEISSGQTVQTNLTGDELFTSPYDCFSILSDLETALNNSDTTALNNSLTDRKKPLIRSAAKEARWATSTVGSTI